MKRLSFAAAIGALAALFAGPASAQNTYNWSGTTSGAWLNNAVWTSPVPSTYAGTSAAPGGGAATDIAVFNAQSGSATGTIGINSATAGTLTLGAIDFTNSTSLTINSSAGAGLLQLNGATVNAVANTLVSVRNTANNQTIASGAGLGLQLGITNGVFNIYGDAFPPSTANPLPTPLLGSRLLTISSVISEATAGSGFSLVGGGRLDLTAANTFTGDVTVTNGRVRITNQFSLGTTAGRTIVNSGGALFVDAAMTLNEDIDLAGTGFIEAATGFGALRVGNVAVSLAGAVTLTDNARVFIAGNTTTINGGLGESGGARNLTTAGAGTLAINSAATYTGTTTINGQGVINLTGATGTALSSGYVVNSTGILRITNGDGANTNGDRIADTATVTLAQGTFNFAHNATAGVNYSESVGALTVGQYLNTVSTSQAAATGETSTLTFASISRAVNSGLVAFSGTGLGAADGRNRILFTTAPTLVGGATPATGGIIGGYATLPFSNTDANFASYDATNGVVAMQNVETSLNAANWAANENVKITLNSTFASGSAAQINSLVLIPQTADASSNLLALSGTLRIGSGGILQTGPTTDVNGTAITVITNVTSATSITAGTANNTPADVIFNINVGTIRLTGSVVNNGTGAVGLIKTGAGTLDIFGLNSNTGPTNVLSGAITLSNNNGFASGTTVNLRANTGNGAQLTLTTGIVADSTVTLNMEAFQNSGLSTANSVIPVSGGLNLRSSLVASGAATWAGPITLNGNHFIQIFQNTAATTLTLSGPISAGAGGFNGMFLTRGAAGGNVAITNTVNLPNGTLATTTGANLLLPNASTNVFGLNAQNGSIRLGGNSQLPAAVVVTLGQSNTPANSGQFWTNGFNQTIAALNIQPNAGNSAAQAAAQIVQNGAGANSTLTFAGNTRPSTFGGTIQNGGTGTLALAITAGTLNLNGANTYTGGTTVSGTGTLGGTGSVTGSVNVNAGGTINPGNSVGTFSVTDAASVMTWAGGGRYTVEYDHSGGALPFVSGTNIDLINSAGSLNITATAGSRFTIDLRYLGSLNAGSNTPQTNVVIATFAGTAPTLTADQFTIAGDFFTGSTPVIAVNGNNIILNFTPVPEPATVGLLAAGALSGLAALRRRRKVAA